MSAAWVVIYKACILRVYFGIYFNNKLCDPLMLVNWRTVGLGAAA